MIDGGDTLQLPVPEPPPTVKVTLTVSGEPVVGVTVKDPLKLWFARPAADAVRRTVPVVLPGTTVAAVTLVVSQVELDDAVMVWLPEPVAEI